MKKHATLLAAAVAASGLMLTGFNVALAQQQQQGQSQQSAGTSAQDSTSPSSLSGTSGASGLSGTLGSATIDQSAKQEIRRTLSQVADAAFQPDGARNLLNHVSRDDRQRLQRDWDQQTQQLRQPATQLREDWRQKYSGDLRIGADSQDVFTALQIQSGQQTDTARPAGARGDASGLGAAGTSGSTDLSGQDSRTQPGAPDSASGAAGTSATGGLSGSTSGADISASGAAGTSDSGSISGTAGTSATGGLSGSTSGADISASGAAGTSDSGRISGTGAAGTSADSSSLDQPSVSPGIGAAGTSTADRSRGALTGADSAQPAGSSLGAMAGMQRATVKLPASEGMSEARLNMVREGGQWKIDLPDSMDAKQLAQSLQQHLQKASQQKGQWPQDENQAKKEVAQHVLMAFQDTGTSGRGADSARPGAGTGSLGTPGATGTSDYGAGRSGASPAPGAGGSSTDTGSTGGSSSGR